MLLKAAELLAAAGELPVNLRFACDGEEEIGGHSIVDWLAVDERGSGRRDRLRQRHGRARRPRLQHRGSRPLLLPRRASNRRPRSSLGDVRRSVAQRDARAHADARTRSFHETDGCPSRSGPASSPPSDDEVAGWSALPAGAAEIAAAGSRAADAAAADEFYVRTWAEPSVDVHGLEGGSPTLVKTVIPVAARANVSIRLVGNQDPAVIAAAFERLLRDAAPEGAELEITMQSSAPPGLVPADAPAVQLGLDAFEEVLGVRPAAHTLRWLDPAGLGARGSRHCDGHDGVRAQRVEHPFAERADPDGVPPARDRDRRSPVPSPRSPWVARPFSSPLAAALSDGVLDRFLRYVRIDTQSEEGAASYPSTAKQLDLSRLLVDELREIGLTDVELTEHGYVFASLPGTEGAPVIGLIAHVDTTPESPGTGVVPIVHENYGGEVLVLPGDPSQTIDPAEESALAARIGHDIVTSDGDDAARRRRQGRRGRDHGCRGVSRWLSWAARERADRVHGRRGGGPRDRTLRPRRLRSRGRLHPRRLGRRRARDRDVLGLTRCASSSADAVPIQAPPRGSS